MAKCDEGSEGQETPTENQNENTGEDGNTGCTPNTPQGDIFYSFGFSMQRGRLFIVL